MAASPGISIAIVGSGGAGALTTGNSLLESGQRRRLVWAFYAAPSAPKSAAARRQRSFGWQSTRSNVCPTNLIC